MDDWTERVYYGGDLPRAAEKALHRAAAAWDRPAEAEGHLADALTAAPDHRAVALAHYKYFFYRVDLARAVPWAKTCLRDSARRLNLPADWRDVSAFPPTAGTEDRDAERRFYLFALKALGYNLLRLGDAEGGRAALRRVLALDATDPTDTAALLAVAERGPEEEEEGKDAAGKDPRDEGTADEGTTPPGTSA